MKYIKLFENWTYSEKIKDIVTECEQILRDLEEFGFTIEVDAYYDMEGYYDIKIESNKYFKLEDIESRIKHLLSYLYEDERIGLYTVLTFSPDRENGRPNDTNNGNITTVSGNLTMSGTATTNNGDTLTSERYKFNANLNNSDLLLKTLPDIKYQFIKLYFRQNFYD